MERAQPGSWSNRLADETIMEREYPIRDILRSDIMFETILFLEYQLLYFQFLDILYNLEWSNQVLIKQNFTQILNFFWSSLRFE